MKKLVLGALLAAAAVTGCAPAPTDAVITAQWSFTHWADKSPRSCPTNYQTVTIYSQVWDPFANALTGVAIKDKFNCDAPGMVGTTDPLDGIFLVWVQVESDSGASLYARSKSIYVDTADGDVNLNFPILDDAGNFFLTWDLQDAVTHAPLTCKEAGVTGNAGVETIATIVNSTFMLTDKFTCDHYFGTTAPLFAGTYTVSVDAFVGNASVGTAPALTNKQITSPNGLTDLGHIIIPIEP